MKTITLKTDDDFFDKVTVLAKQLHLSKSELIRRSISEYEKLMKKRELKEQLKKASYKVREDNRKLNAMFDISNEDGLVDV